MATIEDVTVTIRAVDKVSPVLRRIRRRLWWWKYGDVMFVLLSGLLAVASFILGRITV